MLGKKYRIVGFFVGVLLLSFFCSLDVSANYYDCLSSSLGREDIDSVQWACTKDPPACSLWIGGSGGQSTTFYVESATGTATAYMWGMCTSYAIDAANVVISNDNDSFDDGWGMTVKRGNWGWPTSTPINVDIRRFISGVTPYTTFEGYKAYSRDVNIYRCNANNMSSCSSQNSNVTVIVKEKPGYDRIEEKEEIREGRQESFDINASSALGSVTNSREKAGNYELTGENATINYVHKLWHTNTIFNPGVSYYAGGTSGTVNIYGNNPVNINSALKNQTTSLSIYDETKKVCQNIEYWSKTWTYRYYQKVLVRYNVHYNGDGIEIGRDKISETPIGDEYVDTNYLIGSNSGSSSEACAYLHRPWNFQVALIENKSGESETVYVGESITPSFKININKNNRDFPITDIPNATVTICAGAENNEECTTDYGTIHKDRMDTDTTYSFYNQDSYNLIKTGKESIVPDVPAGSSYCVSISVAPNNSGNGYYSDFNWNAQSIKRCYTVAKKPTVQVWGGNVVSGGDIQSGLTKKVLNGSRIMFGSWGELAVVAGGKIDGFASGASLAKGTSETLSASLMPLTLANTSSNSLGGNFNVNKDKIKQEKDALIKKIEAFEYTNILPESPVSEQVYVKKEGDLYIDKNIEYVDSVTSLVNTPKVLIYATKNIYIGCNVNRLDAIMIAEGVVNTCASSDGSSPDINAHARSNQLVVNGMIIAEGLVLNRTYGAGVGVEASDISAEIINYDTTIELIRLDAKNEFSFGLISVHTRELAPRY